MSFGKIKQARNPKLSALSMGPNHVKRSPNLISSYGPRVPDLSHFLMQIEIEDI